MEKKQILIGFLVIGLLVGNIAIIAFQEAKIAQLELELKESVEINESRDWGAVIYMRIYRSGFLLSEEIHHNVITNAARAALRGHIASSALAVWHYLAIGNSTGGDATSTTLVEEYSRYAADYATVGSYNFTLTFTWTEGNFTAAGVTITELGVFNDATVGTMLNYDDSFSRGPLYEDDSLEVIVNFYIGA